ncbi:alpha-L-rhamnosidase [Paenibacillus amylolyticus]|uniref:family 78 glycoside hydrolase catalytic domain n=1 Tax=Paenibacillus amylolyticus TaxID=1451 RepID=UPI00105A9A82|nr:family 78 glycoside hydrolase catalytic domain [Paenibacillus amylolyticus]TDL69371.1 alpha-L-rhamnosidase [Paenibacillus amylolyticus]
MLQIYDLRTEYLSNPMGLDELRPRFSWKLKSDKIGVMQSDYQIVAYSSGKVIWNSGIINSSESQYIRYEGAELVSRQQVSWKVSLTTTDESGMKESAHSEIAHFEMGLLHPNEWTAKWIEPEADVVYDERKPAPYLRRTFEVKPGLQQARIYQTAHGIYEFWINEMNGTEDKFKPGLTSYYTRLQYQIYDITALLREGMNSWAVMLGDGWWRGVTGGTVKNNFGYKLHYLGQIELTYENGEREVIGSDESFKCSTGGLVASDMLMGDIYDARQEAPEWKSHWYDDSSWKQVHCTTDHTDTRLIASNSVPVREKEHFTARPFRDSAGQLVIDFGQNIAGYVKMKLKNCKFGQEIRLTHGEDLKDGCFSLDNIRDTPLLISAFQEVVYTCSGSVEEEYCPLFSIFGFRYVLVEGYEEEIHEGDFVAVAIYSDMEETGSFTCSNPLINKLVQNSLWSQKGNFMDVPVDCPTRERNAWTGDAQIYVRTATDFMNVYSFFEKWLKDLTLEQYASGKVGITFPSTSSVHNPQELERNIKDNPLWTLAGPSGNGSIGEDSAGWGDAAVWIPYMIYLCYGDKQILINQYETARKWVDYMLACAKDPNPLYEQDPQYFHYEDGELDANYIFDTRMHYGEWLEPIPKKETGESVAEAIMRMRTHGNPRVATAYMYRSAENVAHMAQILKKKEDYRKYKKIAERICKVYDKYLIGDDGVIEPGHQAAYVRVLAMNICSEDKRSKVVKQLIQEIENNDYRLNTGFLSTPFLLHVLVDCGYPEVAFRILEQTENPGWLHAVLLGSTTILEKWDGMDRHHGSYNHYSYGAVCDFLFSRVAGITPLFESPGYREFELRPVPGGTLTYAEAIYESLYGTIRSRWEQTESGLNYECSVPVNTRARVYLPNGQCISVGSGDYNFYS